MTLLKALLSVRSERMLMENIGYIALFYWLVILPIGAAVVTLIFFEKAFYRPMDGTDAFQPR